MADLYDGPTDARQSASEVRPSDSPFMPRYRKLTDEEVALHDEIKAKAHELYELMQKVKPVACSDDERLYKVQARIHLETSVMYVIKALVS